MASEDLSVFGAIDDEKHGVTLPRIYTPPLRPLDKNTSNGFAVIAFAEIMLKVHLYPWQCWLLVHALELLEDGMELKRLGFNAREEEFSEVTKLSLSTVASVYHVSPVMVGILDNANFSNTKEFRKMLYSETLGPTMRMIEDRINTFLAPKVGAPDANYIEFDIRSKLSGDFEEQASVMSTSVGAPWITPNEARASQNLPRVDGGDELVVPLNVTKGGQSSPQDGGDPSRPADGSAIESDDGEKTAVIVNAWHDRLEKSVRSRFGAGMGVDDIKWLKWQNELQADLTIKAGLGQFDAGVRALQETEDMRTHFKEVHDAL